MLFWLQRPPTEVAEAATQGVPGLKMALQKLAPPETTVIKLPPDWENGDLPKMVALASQHLSEHEVWPMSYWHTLALVNDTCSFDCDVDPPR
jgi:hypothetical protein